MHVMFVRLEQAVSEIDREAKICNVFAIELSITEKIEFISRVHVAKRMLIFAKSYVNSKADLLPNIIKTNFFAAPLNNYFLSMGLNMKKLNQKINSSMKLLASSEQLYGVIGDVKLSDNSERMTDLMKIFSGAAIIVLPLLAIIGLFGMNIHIPFQATDDDESVLPFTIICVLSLCYLLIITICFRYKQWI